MPNTIEAKEVREASAPKLEKAPELQKKRFEIAIYQADYENSDANGNPIANWKKVNYDKPVIIEATCKKDLDELQKQYRMCDQKFEIIRPLDPTPFPPSTPQQTASSASASKAVATANPIVQQQAPIAAIAKDATVPIEQKTKPRIITIGDIQLKYDGDKIYQKQWIKLNQIEQQNIRVVNDSNNKIVSMSGKHFEVKKWVLVEQSQNEDEEDILSEE